MIKGMKLMQMWIDRKILNLGEYDPKLKENI